MSGCALQQPQPVLHDVPELSDVPFFTQTEFDCGPAALATLLNDEGIDVTPADLIGEVYIDGLEGSLQVELLAATRRHGLLPIPVGPEPADLLAEIESGQPVLVMQNLRLARLPAWHYAVVIGYSSARDRFVLRSGDERRREERASRFLHSWRLADNWAFVAVPAGKIPVTATPDTYMRALLGAQDHLPESSTNLGYRAAVSRWPNDPFVLFLSAARAHALDDLVPAGALYRRALEADPSHTAARNNLAHVLLAQGCRDQAAHEARIALRFEPTDGDYYETIQETIREIESANGLATCS